jgi:hypothetical protein
MGQGRQHNTRSRLIMEIDAMLFWNIILTMVVVPFGWAFNKMFQEVKRIQILLNKTREEYATKEDVRQDLGRVMEALHRLEDKLDRVLSIK